MEIKKLRTVDIYRIPMELSDTTTVEVKTRSGKPQGSASFIREAYLFDWEHYTPSHCYYDTDIIEYNILDDI